MLDRSSTDAAAPGAELLPPDIWKRQSAKWLGLQVDILEVNRLGCEAEAQFHGSSHLLIASEVLSAHKCETSIEGLPKSTLRDFSGKLTFIPAGHRFERWAKVRTPLRAVYLYLDPDSPILPPHMRFREKELKPIMSFTDRNLWATVLKLKRCVERPQEVLHAEALELMLAYELLWLDKRVSARVAKGGLDARQKEWVAGYIEEHVAEHISLLTLAQIAGLSTGHFTRAFKSSFGVTPYRYLRNKRIERAKLLLPNRYLSTTQVALMAGFSETSFSAAFQRATKQRPS
jgi:AraC family transcriptional regulator